MMRARRVSRASMTYAEFEFVAVHANQNALIRSNSMPAQRAKAYFRAHVQKNFRCVFFKPDMANEINIDAKMFRMGASQIKIPVESDGAKILIS